MDQGVEYRIDSHVHVFRAGVRAAGDARYVPDYEASARQLFEHHDRAGISAAVLVQPSFLGTDNSLMLETLRRWPSRLRAVAVVGPETPASLLANWHDAGVRAIRFNLFGARALPESGSTAWRALAAALAELRWHVEVHVEPERLALALDALATLGSAVVVDHMGRPDDATIDGVATALARHARERPLWVKLSASYRWPVTDRAAAIARIADAVGCDRLLWASDWPWTGNERGRSFDEALGLLDSIADPQARRAVAAGNAARLYGWGDGDRT